MIKRGSKIRVVKMDTAGGMDWQAKRLEGKVFTVRSIVQRSFPKTKRTIESL